MQAIICDNFGSPENLSVSVIDEPVPKADEVLVKVKAVGLGYVDALTVAGRYQIKPELPFIPGNELTGIVEKAGSDVKHLRAGQRILATPRMGALAQLICIPQKQCSPMPGNLDFAAAASLSPAGADLSCGLAHYRVQSRWYLCLFL